MNEIIAKLTAKDDKYRTDRRMIQFVDLMH